MSWDARVVLGSVVFVAGCLTPTEITVTITSREVSCGQGDLVFGDLALYATPDQASLLTSSPSGTSNACNARGSGVNLGSIVLTPRDGTQKASLLVVAGVSLPNASKPLAATADQCASEYASFLAAGAPRDYCKDPIHACGACIVAQREIGFVSHTRLELEVELSAQCKGVFCEVGLTCGGNGDCVSAEAPCAGGKCSLGAGGSGAGGAGGTGGQGGDTSTVSSSAMGGAGGGCSDLGIGVALGFASVPGGFGGAGDVAADGTGSAFVAQGADVLECTPTLCSKVYPGSGALRDMSADPSGAAAARGNDLVYRIGGGPWTVFTPLPVCDLVTGTLAGTSSAAGHIYYAGQDSVGGFESTTDAPNCNKGIINAGPGAGRVFALSNGHVWLATPSFLQLSITNGSMGGGPLGAVSDLWGYVASPTLDVGFACTQQGVYRGTYDGVIYKSGPILQTPCRSLSGVARCDGTADLWMVSGADGSLSAFHVGPATSVANIQTIPMPTPAANSTAVSVDRDAVWLVGGTGIRRSPRPLLP